MPSDPDPQFDANFRFLPFIVALLSDDPLPRSGARLPLDDRKALTRECVDAAGEVCRQATLRWLCRMGWPRVTYLDACRGITQGRVWDAFADDMALRFTDDSMRCLLYCYNLTRGGGAGATDADDAGAKAEPEHSERSKQSEATPPQGAAPRIPPVPQAPRLTELGDLLVNHIAWSSLADTLPPGVAAPRYFAGNPLNLLAHFERFEALSQTSAVLERALGDDVAFCLPWLMRHFAHGWLRREGARWARSPAQLLQACERQSLVLGQWVHLLAGRDLWHLLVPLVEYFAQWHTTHGPQCLVRFEAATQGRPLSHRQEMADGWRGSMQPLWNLAQCHRRVRALHPVDREPRHRFFIDACARGDLDGVIKYVEELAASLLPSFG